MGIDLVHILQIVIKTRPKKCGRIVARITELSGTATGQKIFAFAAISLDSSLILIDYQINRGGRQ